MASRADLLALNPDSLAALANRGLVKRAVKDLDAGVVPEIEVTDDGTVSGTFADGVRTTLPAGAGLETASCSCSAPGVCRHRIGLVLAYQRTFDGATAPEPFAAWSPGGIEDATISELLGGHVVDTARRAYRAGYRARLVRPTAAAPIPRVELSSCSVRFLVPGELGYAETDATTANRAEMITLAVWAFREADTRGLLGDDVQLDVGGQTTYTTGTSGLESTVDAIGELLLTGVMHTSPLLGTRMRHLARELETAGLHWPSAAVAEIETQLDAYQARSARHETARLAELLTEVHARHRAVSGGGESLRSRVLGTDQPAETPLRRVRFTALGGRVGGTEGERTAEVFLAHNDTVLVLRKSWPLHPDQTLTGHELASRRIARTTFGLLASGNVVTESAVRNASRVLRFGSDRLAKTTVSPVGDAWETLPDSVLVRDFAALGAELGALPPRLVRPRVEAELVRVLRVAEVVSMGYDPGEQRLEAVVADESGTTATVSALHRSSCPGALDALAEALSGEPRLISGSVHRSRGTVIVDPIAVLTPTGVVVPDLSPGDGDSALDHAAHTDAEPLTRALTEGLAVCAEAAHRGLRLLPPSLRTRAEQAAADLAKVGLSAAADHLVLFVKALGEDEHAQVTAWVNAQIRLLATHELR